MIFGIKSVGLFEEKKLKSPTEKRKSYEYKMEGSTEVGK